MKITVVGAGYVGLSLATMLSAKKDHEVTLLEISKERVEKVEDVLSIGDKIIVKVLEIDDQGRINLKKVGDQGE